MLTKKKRESGLKKKTGLSPSEKSRRKVLVAFAKIYNNNNGFPANHDLEHAFGTSMDAIQKRARRYRATRKRNPDWRLPFLVGREPGRGGLIEVPETVMELLDQFRYEGDKFAADAKRAGGFVVTSAQFGAPLNPWHWKALKHYARARRFPLVVLPIKYGTLQTWQHDDSGEMKLASSFPDELKGRVLLDDVLLCRGELQLNLVRMRPTLTRFLTDDICALGHGASQIMAAPVLELDRRPLINRRMAKTIMTTGACTHPNYVRDKLGQQDRTGEIAKHNHKFAAIVVEFSGEDKFHFRQLESSRGGVFYDIDALRGGAIRCTPDGVRHEPKGVDAIVTGDWHAGITCPTVRMGTFGDHGMVQTLRPQSGVVMHDFIDGRSCSHYEERQGIRRAYKAQQRRLDSLQEELDAAIAEAKWIHKQTTRFVPGAKTWLAASNHPEFILKYIEEMRFRNDDINLVIGMRLFLKAYDDMEARKPAPHMIGPIDPVILWMREHCPEVVMLDRQESLLLPKGAKNASLVSLHGDVGVRGGESRSTNAFKKWSRPVILGHNHSALILGPVWRVGTSTPLTQFYVSNPRTDWSNTHCVIFANGQRQLINFVKGNWHGRTAKTRKRS